MNLDLKIIFFKSWQVEDNLDITMSAQKETADKLEIADKESIDAELQVGALKRRLALLEEEASRNKTKLQGWFSKLKLALNLFFRKHWKM